MERFTVQEKRELLKEVLLRQGKAKMIFEDSYLSSKVIRYPLTVGNAYAGRDIICVYDPLKSYEATELAVAFASPYYRLAKNEELLSALRLELDETVPEYKEKIKRESIADLSALYLFQTEEGDEGRILVRNSYVPHRSLQVILGVGGLPVIKVAVRHNEAGLTAFNLRETIGKIPMVLPVLEELSVLPARELPENVLSQIEDIKIKKSKTVGAVRTEHTHEIGRETILAYQEAPAIEFMRELLKRVYSTNLYTLKRKVENILLSFFEVKLAELEVSVSEAF